LPSDALKEIYERVKARQDKRAQGRDEKQRMKIDFS
jgi:hypothetical protein